MFMPVVYKWVVPEIKQTVNVEYRIKNKAFESIQRNGRLLFNIFSGAALFTLHWSTRVSIKRNKCQDEL